MKIFKYLINIINLFKNSNQFKDSILLFRNLFNINSIMEIYALSYRTVFKLAQPTVFMKIKKIKNKFVPFSLPKAQPSLHSLRALPQCSVVGRGLLPHSPHSGGIVSRALPQCSVVGGSTQGKHSGAGL